MLNSPKPEQPLISKRKLHKVRFERRKGGREEVGQWTNV